MQKTRLKQLLLMGIIVALLATDQTDLTTTWGTQKYLTDQTLKDKKIQISHSNDIKPICCLFLLKDLSYIPPSS